MQIEPGLEQLSYIPFSRDLPKTVTPLMGADSVLSNCSEIPNSSILDRRYAEIPKELEERIKALNERDMKVGFFEKIGYVIYKAEKNLEFVFKALNFLWPIIVPLVTILTWINTLKNKRRNNNDSNNIVENNSNGNSYANMRNSQQTFQSRNPNN